MDLIEAYEKQLREKVSRVGEGWSIGFHRVEGGLYGATIHRPDETILYTGSLAQVEVWIDGILSSMRR